jgi:glycosyltransferase involved in cell wall biosynthesis
VVVATYNRAEFLPDTIRSILGQTYRNYELIIVDDGSTDHTREALKPYESQLRYIYQSNQGPSAARNAGVAQAKGEWIAIQDSDDLSAPNHLAVFSDYVIKHPDCGMVFANGRYLSGREHDRETLIPAEKSRRLARDGVRLEDLFERSIVRLQAALISKRAYNLIGGHDESLRICMDLDLSFRLLLQFPVGYIDAPLFFYRKHEGNTGRNEELRLTENIRVIEKLVAAHPEVVQSLGKEKIAARTAYRYYRLAKGRWKRGMHAEAREALRSATELRPFALKYRLYQLRWDWARN